MIVRISIGNLVPILSVPAGEVDSYHAVGILNTGSYAKGKMLLQPIGGAAELTPKGRRLLEEKYRARGFHKNDARFLVDDQHLDEIFALFSVRDPEVFEIDPLREIIEELSSNEFPENEHLPGISPILSIDQASALEVIFRATVRQPFTDEAGTSPLAGKEPSRRLFHLFELVLPSREMFKQIITSWATHELSLDEVGTVQGGLSKGKTRHGITIADNFILPE